MIKHACSAIAGAKGFKRPIVLDAVTEGIGKAAANNIATMKKDAMSEVAKILGLRSELLTLLFRLTAARERVLVGEVELHRRIN
jgi:hydroxyethylthiazole kinase-like sugar kinase family protein